MSTTVRGLPSAGSNVRVYGGLIAAERPLAAELASNALAAGSAQLDFINPGRVWPGERLGLVVDFNGNQRCDEGDVGANVGFDRAGEVTVGEGAWVRGAALTPICDALALGPERHM